MPASSFAYRLSRNGLRVIWLWLCLFVASTVSAQTLSPFQFGLREAHDPTEVYRVLLRTHQAADSCGGTVSYRGIDTLRLAIPPDAKSIPLQADNDFGGAVFVVTNTAKGLFLFKLTPPSRRVPVDDTLALCQAIDNGDFYAFPQLREGHWLLHIVDSTPWVDRRVGYKYGHYRQDILTLHDGVSHDAPATPYNDGSSRPCIFARRLDSASSAPVTFSNITLLRDSVSSCPTYLILLENLPQATLRNIVVATPRSKALSINDAIIRIYNCTNIFIDSLTLWGTYSRLNHSGYGILMNNLRNTHIRKLKTISDWGVFGTNNMTETFIEYSDFNRFDIHCYGRDVTFDHCLQRNGYNQFSSVFGTIAFHSCTFDKFVPVLIEESYNAYTHFLLSFESCRWWPTASHNTLFKGGRIDSHLNSREELQAPALPDIYINGLEINTNKGIKQVEILQLGGNERHAHVHRGLNRVTLQGITLRGNPDTKIILSNKRVDLHQEAKIETPGIPQETKTITRIGPKTVMLSR